MADKTKIANLALTMLAAENIMDINEASESASKIRTVYDSVRNAVFAEHPWNFCSKDVQLGALTSKPLIGFSYEYTLPVDLVRLNTVYDSVGNVLESNQYRVTNNNILQCNTVPVIINYNFIVTDETKFPPLFVQAFAARLAFELCYSITGSRTLQADLWELYIQKSLISKHYNAVENNKQTIKENQYNFPDTWIGSRY